jgi:hypothetical protein
MRNGTFLVGIVEGDDEDCDKLESYYTHRAVSVTQSWATGAFDLASPSATLAMSLHPWEESKAPEECTHLHGACVPKSLSPLPGAA